MKKLKIAYLLPNCDVSGGVAVVLQHSNRLKKRGHDVLVATTDKVTKTNWFPNQSVPVITAQNLPADLDILVATSWATAFATAKIKAKHKCYFVQSDETRFHDYGNDFYHITQLTYLMNYHYLTEARWLQRWLLENFDKTATLIPNGLDSNIFYPTAPLEKRNNKFRILLEGAIWLPYKGVREAFDVVKDLDVEVWCISSYGKPESYWKCDRFFEKVPMTKMKEIYSSCDILLKLSRVEGFFGPPLEMMACGGVCVIGKVTGYDEYIVDGENAIVVDPTNIDQARSAVLKIMEDRELREKLKKNGLETAKQWDWEKSIDKLEQYFMEIAENKYGQFNAVRQQTNQSVAFFYDKLLSTSFDSNVMAHKLGKKIKSIWLKNFLKRIYFHMKSR
ncbi:MAG: glycosyltransferase family 4 protein [Nitrospirota bacterium]